MRSLLFALVLFLTGHCAAFADQAATLFDDSKVHEIRLYFDDPNWYNTLYQGHANNPDDPYFPARIQYGDVSLDNIGVRFKGNASFRRSSSVKKSFKLDFNRFVDDAKFLGLKKLNLNNGDLQPDFLREKLFLDFASRYIPAMRAVHTRVYVNDQLWGLYIAVEEPDKTMMQSRFGDAEDGNLYEAAESNATLAYLGASQSAYESLYELKTNEEANDYSDLIQFLDILNNTPAASLPAKLEPICDVENMLFGIALNNLFVNLDSYAGSASEFMLYHRQDTGQFIHIHWDLNESFGTTGDGSPRITNPPALDPFWLPTSSSGAGAGGPGGGGSSASGNARPLMEKLWAVDSYKRTYLRQLARMLREGFDSTTYYARIKELADVIREDVYADPNKFYTNAQFETALTTSIAGGQTPIQGLLQFVKSRQTYLKPVLDSYARPADLRLNEVVSLNSGGALDGVGDADPWVEIHNLGPGVLDLGSFALSDDPANLTKWTLPAKTLAAGDFLVVWLDGEPEEGAEHAVFRAEPSGGVLTLAHTANGVSTLIDTVEYPAWSEGSSYVRLGSAGTAWALTNRPTPGAANLEHFAAPPPAPGLVINEFMADNKTTLANPEAGSFDDWIEIFNPGAVDVDMSGMYLTDDLSNPAKYRIPDGVIIPAGGYLLFWADDNPALGPLHASIKLSADGEEIGLFATDGVTAVDSITFGKQQTDISHGRTPDGGTSWADLTTPTPGSANAPAK